jgi:hypothetical protein
MQPSPHTLRRLVGSVALVLPLAACSIDVAKNDAGRNSGVDVRTPVADVSVHRDPDAARDIGLPVYPGAVVSRDPDEESGRVSFQTPWFGLGVAAAKFESEAPAETVVAFYRREMRPYGRVTECRGELDFEGDRGFERPVCKESRSRLAAVQLLAGSEESRRMVAVKPRGQGSEFLIVLVTARGSD